MLKELIQENHPYTKSMSDERGRENVLFCPKKETRKNFN
jgi:hypothetical protein